MPHQDSDMIAELRNLLDARPELTISLRGAKSLDDAAEILSRVAAVNGLPMAAAELRHYFKEITALREGPVEDGELEQVIGGATDIGGAVLDILHWNRTT